MIQQIKQSTVNYIHVHNTDWGDKNIEGKGEKGARFMVHDTG